MITVSIRGLGVVTIDETLSEFQQRLNQPGDFISVGVRNLTVKGDLIEETIMHCVHKKGINHAK